MKVLILLTGLILARLSFVSAQEEIKTPVPCSIKIAKFGTDSVNNENYLVLYQENFKQWKNSGYKSNAINSAINAWRHVFLDAPLASNNIYTDGLIIVEYMIKNAQAPELKEKYIDTLMMVYDRRIEAFGCKRGNEEGLITGRKAVDLLKYRPNEKIVAFDMFEKSLAIQKKKTESAVVISYFKLIIDMVQEGKKDTADIFIAYERMNDITSFNIIQTKEMIDQNPADSAKLDKKLNSWIVCESKLKKMFAPFTGCGIITKIYSSRYENNKTDTVFLKRLINLLEKEGCTGDSLFLEACKDNYHLSPVAENAFLLGKAYNTCKQYIEAAKFVGEASNGFSSVNNKFNAQMLLSDIYKNAGQYSLAKSAAIKASELKPTNGLPYIIIGDLYYNTALTCGNDAVTSHAGYWAAYDQYNKAKSDPEVANLANSKAKNAYVNFPKAEDIFFLGYIKGNPYTISCWYTETTIIRSTD